MSDFFDDTCGENDDACMYSIVAIVIVTVLAVTVFAYFRPLKDLSREMSALLSFFLFPVYLVFYGYQNPISEEGGIATSILLLFFWPLMFFLPYRETTSCKVTDSGDYV